VNKAHALIIALALGVAAVAGTFAALETTAFGAEAATASSSDLAARQAELDRTAKRRPPALPPLPSRSAASVAAAPAAPVVPSGSGSYEDDHGDDDRWDDHGSDDDGHHAGDDDRHEDDD
jgi:hypothetical protein